MRRIEFKAYGGTGTLIGRSFVTLLALNACDVAKEDCENDVCVIYQMDYDDVAPLGNSTNDGKYFQTCIENYQKLYDRKLKFIAPIRLELSSATLKNVRRRAYGSRETEYSLQSLFCRGPHNQEIYELLSSAFTTDRNSQTQEIERSNRDGCYGDLAVNGFISERLIASNAFVEEGIYNDLIGNLKDAVVFYAGSTDGGTANTMIDKDIRSLLHYLNDSGRSIKHDREFRVYGLRTTPYSCFELKGDAHDIEITESILRDKFEMSQGVFDNIQHQNNECNNDSIENYSYYYLNPSQCYWLDALFVSGSETLDITSDRACKNNQYHPSHLTELSAAMQAMDALAGRVKMGDGNTPHIFGYNDGGGGEKNNPVTLESFFANAIVNYEFGIFDASGKDGTVSLVKYIRAFVLTLVSIKGKIIPDCRATINKHNARYIYDLFNKCHGDETVVCPLVAKELEAFLDEAKFIVMTLHNAIEFSKFKRSDSPVRLVEEAVKYIYNKDIFGNPIEIPAGNSLSLTPTASTKDYNIRLSTFADFALIDDMHTVPFHDGNIFGAGSKISSECAYRDRLQGANDEESAFNIANDLIKRTFEMYLDYII